jgi:hypothetical protein
LSPLERGIEFHNALDRYNRGEWIKREYLPFVRVIIGWLKGLAPEKIYSEWDLNGHSLRGRPDLFVIGGTLNCRGILEVKVSGRGSPLLLIFVEEEFPFDSNYWAEYWIGRSHHLTDLR